MLEEVKYTDSTNPLEMFLKGHYIMKTEEVAEIAEFLMLLVVAGRCPN